MTEQKNVIDYTIMTRMDMVAMCIEDYLFGQCSNQTARSVIAVAKWFKEAATREPDKRMLCLCCENTFSKKAAPEAMLIVLPWEDLKIPGGRRANAVVSGICPDCYAKPDLEQTVHNHVRSVFPGYKPVHTDIGHA